MNRELLSGTISWRTVAGCRDFVVSCHFTLLNGLDRQYDVLFMNFTGTYRKTFFFLLVGARLNVSSSYAKIS